MIGEDRKGIDQSRENKIKMVGPWELVGLPILEKISVNCTKNKNNSRNGVRSTTNRRGNTSSKSPNKEIQQKSTKDDTEAARGLTRPEKNRKQG